MKTEYRKKLAMKIRQHMAENNLTSGEMAVKLRLKAKTFCAYLEGRAAPELFVIKDICGIFKISIDEFAKDLTNPQC